MDPYLTPYTKIKTKWIKDLNIRAKTIKLLEGSIGQKLHDVGFGNDFLCMTLKVQVTKENRQIGLSENFFKFVHQKTLNIVKKQPSD